MKIDFVVTWVDGNDLKWRADKSRYDSKNPEINTDIRYQEYGLFKYWFRAVEKYAPWVNKVFVVTEGHKPEWLNIDSDKLVFIKHSDYMPKDYLPTFSSNPIELNLHRIPELSEHFVLFSDDVFLAKTVSEDDFFHKGLPRDYGIYSPVIPDTEFSNVIFNNVRLINRHFSKKDDLKQHWQKFISYRYGSQQLRTIATLPWSKITGYLNMHVTSSLLKSTLETVWRQEYTELDNTSKNKFRTLEDVNHWIFKYWQIESGKFYPQSLKFGAFYTLNSFDKLIKALKKNKYKVICVNDDYNVQNYEEKIMKIIEVFEKNLSTKSSFEK